MLQAQALDAQIYIQICMECKHLFQRYQISFLGPRIGDRTCKGVRCMPRGLHWQCPGGFLPSVLPFSRRCEGSCAKGLALWAAPALMVICYSCA